jgi:hypothetical protein
MSDLFFKCEIGGEEKEFEIKPITSGQQREAQKIYNQAFSDAVKSGSIVRARLDDLLKEQGLWDDNKQQKFSTLQKQILDNERILSKGGISLKDARSTAIRTKKLREDLRDLISVKTNLDTNTAEGQADNARFNYLVSACVVYKDTQQPYFKDYEDYINKATDIVAIYGAQKLAFAMYGLDTNFEKKLPENKFLLKYKLVNDDLHYVDSKGRLVNEDGRLVDENNRFINEEGKFVDIDGNLVDESGDYIVEFAPFTDDDGNPIILDENNAKEPGKKKKSNS